jgi:hypothetical protein
MKADKLLRELEKLTHSGRVRRMVELGRTAAANPNTASLIDELEQGDFYERSLALQSCFGSKDGEHMLRARRFLQLLRLQHICRPT